MVIEYILHPLLNIYHIWHRRYTSFAVEVKCIGKGKNKAYITKTKTCLDDRQRLGNQTKNQNDPKEKIQDLFALS